MFRQPLTREWQLIETQVDAAAIHVPDQRPIAIAFASSTPLPALEGEELTHRPDPYLFINGSGRNLYARAAYAKASVVEYLVGRGGGGGPGRDGPNAYEVFVANGYTGTIAEWMDYIRGGPELDEFRTEAGAIRADLGQVAAQALTAIEAIRADALERTGTFRNEALIAAEATSIDRDFIENRLIAYVTDDDVSVRIVIAETMVAGESLSPFPYVTLELFTI